MSSGRRVIEKQCRLASELGGIDVVLHQQEHVHIVRFRFVGEEGAKDHKPGQLPGGAGYAVDSISPPRHDRTWQRSRAESVEYFLQRCPMHAHRQIPHVRQRRQPHRVLLLLHECRTLAISCRRRRRLPTALPG